MTDVVHLRKLDAVRDCGRFEDDRPSEYFYFDDLPIRRLWPDIMTKAQKVDGAQAFARAELEKLQG